MLCRKIVPLFSTPTTLKFGIPDLITQQMQWIIKRNRFGMLKLPMTYVYNRRHGNEHFI